MNKAAFKNHIKHNIYILKVSPKYSAEKPISAGPNINPEKPEEILLGDKGILLSVIGWILSVAFVGFRN